MRAPSRARRGPASWSAGIDVGGVWWGLRRAVVVRVVVYVWGVDSLFMEEQHSSARRNVFGMG